MNRTSYAVLSFFFSVLKGPFGLNTRKPSVHIIRGYGAKLGKACKVYDIKLFTAPLIENELVWVFLRCDDEKYLGVDRCFKREKKILFLKVYFFFIYAMTSIGSKNCYCAWLPFL